jgi:anti-anti-sigma regulatory factor
MTGHGHPERSEVPTLGLKGETQPRRARFVGWQSAAGREQEESGVQLNTVMTPAGRVITIDVDENLDLSLHSLFVRACELAAASDSDAIEVNVANIRHVRDSGLAMLMMLRDRARRRGDRVKLVNCGPELRRRLLAGRIGANFSLS